MYAYFAKGMTVGHVLTRLVLREITSVPGVVLDLMFAIFWVPDYSSYWAENSAYIEYADGTRHTGVMRGLFGWIGEILGFAIGGTIGAIIGTALFFPDLLFRGILYFKEKLFNTVDDIAVFIGARSFFEEFNVYDNPTSYMQKAWNLGAGILGMAIAAIPYAGAKVLEFLFPFLYLSQPVTVLSSSIGGLMGWGVATIIAPPLYLLSKASDLIELCRNSVFKTIALIYAKSGQVPVGPENRDEECCVPYQAVHTEEFRQQVNYYGRTSWAQLIFGPLRGEKAEVYVGSFTQQSEKSDHLVDPITFEPLGANGVPTVIDRHGHTFNEDRGTATRGIRFWINAHHNCPIGREPLYDADLVPNRAFDDLRAQHQH